MRRMGAPTHIEMDFTMAFQPIVDIGAGGSVFAYEALVRGPGGQGADKVFSDVSPILLNAFGLPKFGNTRHVVGWRF